MRVGRRNEHPGGFEAEGSPSPREEAAGILSVNSAKELLRGFVQLWSRWRADDHLLLRVSQVAVALYTPPCLVKSGLSSPGVLLLEFATNSVQQYPYSIPFCGKLIHPTEGFVLKET